MSTRLPVVGGHNFSEGHMDCELCNTTAATHLLVPTNIGLVANVCDDCLRQYGRVLNLSELEFSGGPD